MYVTVQFIILEILLGLIFLVILYFMVRELLKKIIRRELKDLKEPLQVLADYLVQQSQEPEGPDDPDSTGQPGNGPLPASSPEKIPEVPVDIADEFNQLKNTNRISAYNIRVQKIWDLFKQKKITVKQYREELLRLKKEFGIPAGNEQSEAAMQEAKQGKSAAGVKLKPLTPTPSAAPKQKVKHLDTEPEEDENKDAEVEKGAAKKSSPGTDMYIRPLD
jgi:hypothetical protein